MANGETIYRRLGRRVDFKLASWATSCQWCGGYFRYAAWNLPADSACTFSVRAATNTHDRRQRQPMERFCAMFAIGMVRVSAEGPPPSMLEVFHAWDAEVGAIP